MFKFENKEEILEWIKTNLQEDTKALVDWATGTPVEEHLQNIADNGQLIIPHLKFRDAVQTVLNVTAPSAYKISQIFDDIAPKIEDAFNENLDEESDEVFDSSEVFWELCNTFDLTYEGGSFWVNSYC